MTKSLFVALAAGAASALMFASIISGALIAIPLFYFAPLPLMVAAMGWSALHGAIAGIVAAVCLGLLFGPPYFAVFAVTIALPACWLGYLAQRQQQPLAGAAEPSSANWYPTGRLLLWVTVFASLIAMAALLTLGSDNAEISAALRSGLSRMMGARDPSLRTSDQNDRIDALVALAPAAAAVVSIVTLSLNLWFAARITATSGRLVRPWPDLSDTTLPPMTLVALPVALAFCFGGGLLAIIAQIVAAALLMAYALTGLATFHVLTRGRAHRTLWLMMTYAFVIVLGWPAAALIALGLADAYFGLRHRAAPHPRPTT